ncbi:MAG: PcfJ domain-containing protein [Oscillospiraceae bacterium]
MKDEKALELLKGFPDITPEIEKQMRNLLKQYIIVDHKKGICRCTYCEQAFPFSKIRQVEIPHKGITNCPECGEYVTLIQNYHNFNGSVLSDEVNCMVFLSSPNDDNLYIRCFGLRVMFEKRKLAPNIYIDEYQRYVFTEKNAARYGRNKNWYREPLAPGTYYYGFNWSEWVHRKQVTEPVFRTYQAAYQCVNIECIKDTCMRFSAADMVKFTYPMYPITYLRFYQKNPGAERLIKCKLGYLVSNDLRDRHMSKINYKETEPHRMLGVDKQAFRAIRDGRIKYEAYLSIAKEFPGKSVDTLVAYDHVINGSYGTLDRVCYGRSKEEVVKYLMKQTDIDHGALDIYKDYIDICHELRYDFKDKAVIYPRNLAAAHDRAVEAKAAIEAVKERGKNIERTKRMQKMKKMRSKLEFRSGEYMVIQPESAEDIVREGKVLSHCVGGYAGRHADGKLSIMFLRKVSEPDKPFYTIEVSSGYSIVQCRGYANNVQSRGGVPKPDDIKEFEKLYQAHLNEVYDMEVKRKAKAKQIKEGA